jgi:hypothetical protein
MKTFLQTINDFTAEHITMPLKLFFLYITIGLWIILIAIALYAPLSLSKFMALFGLYSTSIITALLTYANSILEQNNKLETVSETPNDISDGETNLSHDSAFVA